MLLTTGQPRPTARRTDRDGGCVGSLTIPANIPRPNNGTGTYYLHFYDDRGRLVNELDETNNHWTEGPIIVEAPAATGSSACRRPAPG